MKDYLIPKELDIDKELALLSNSDPVICDLLNNSSCSSNCSSKAVKHQKVIITEYIEKIEVIIANNPKIASSKTEQIKEALATGKYFVEFLGDDPKSLISLSYLKKDIQDILIYVKKSSPIVPYRK